MKINVKKSGVSAVSSLNEKEQHEYILTCPVCEARIVLQTDVPIPTGKRIEVPCPYCHEKFKIEIGDQVDDMTII